MNEFERFVSQLALARDAPPSPFPKNKTARMSPASQLGGHPAGPAEPATPTVDGPVRGVAGVFHDAIGLADRVQLGVEM